MYYPTSKRFVNRDEQRQTVRNVLHGIESGEQRFAGLEFYGIDGLGKSRMLDQAKEICRETGLGFATIDFSAGGDMTATPPYGALLLQLCAQLDHYLAVPALSAARALLLSAARMQSGTAASLVAAEAEGAGAAGLSWEDVYAAFLARLIDALGDAPLVVMLDSTEQASDDLFDWLGREFFRRLLVVEGTCLALFLAGRGPRVLESGWPRSLARATVPIRLDPLDFAGTEEHLGELPPGGLYREAAKDIYALSNGHPYSTEALAYWLNTLGVQVEAVGAQREYLARRLYDEVIGQYVLADAGEWVLPFVEVAAVPRHFDAGMLNQLVSQYRPTLGGSQPVQWYVARLVDLQQAPLYLVYLGKRAPAYELEPTLRKLLHTALAILSPAETLAMHKDVHGMWRSWLMDGAVPGGSRANAVTQAVYHVAQVAVIEGENAAEGAKRELQGLLEGHFDRLEIRDVEELNVLRGLLSQDSDVLELLGKEAVAGLVRQVDRFLQPEAAVPEREVGFVSSHLVIEHIPPTGYRVSWYQGNEVVLPTDTVHSARRFSIEKWRSQPEAIGKAAFRSYLPSRAQECVREKRNWAIQLSTDWADIPWELLHDGEDFLCLSRPIARKLKLLKEARQHGARPEGALRALVVGNPTGDLPGAEAEAEAVADLLGSVEKPRIVVDLLVGPKHAMADDFAVKLTNQWYDLIHYAGHGYFEPNAPHQSGLRFSDGPIFAEELERQLNSRPFVFLSACEAAETETTRTTVGFRGHFIEGLAISALLGGAMGCLGPMWTISDRVAKDFALAFYERLLGGQTIAEAVRLARLAIRDGSPDCWAGWVLYGDLGATFGAWGKAPSDVDTKGVE